MKSHNALSAIGKIAAIIGIFLVSQGCGGGTSGTDIGGGTKVLGNVKRSNQAPLPEAEVSILETGDSTITDSTGTFELTTTLSDNAITFLVRADNSSLVSESQLIPNQPKEIAVILEFDEMEQVVRTETIQIKPRPTPKPERTSPPLRSTPIPRPTKIGRTPTPVPIRTPKVHPTVTPTPTPRLPNIVRTPNTR